MLEVVAGYVRMAASGLLHSAANHHALQLGMRVLEVQALLEERRVEPAYLPGRLPPDQAVAAAVRLLEYDPVEQGLHGRLAALLQHLTGTAKRGW